MQCPKCGFEQPEAEECRACGIIFRKYNPQAARETISRSMPAPDSTSAEAPATGRFAKSHFVVLFAIVLVAWAGFGWWSGRPVSHGPGVVAPEPPEQVASEAAPFDFKDYRVAPLAGFRASARVLATKSYSFDRGADLAPVDLALGWGRMSDETVLDRLKIHQSNRFYFWQTEAFPIPREEIENSSANMHLIPADSDIRKRIKKARVGDVVDVSGYLVEVTGEDNWKWKSSLSRNDTGNGACEVIFVEDFRIREL